MCGCRCINRWGHIQKQMHEKYVFSVYILPFPLLLEVYEGLKVGEFSDMQDTLMNKSSFLYISKNIECIMKRVDETGVHIRERIT